MINENMEFVNGSFFFVNELFIRIKKEFTSLSNMFYI